LGYCYGAHLKDRFKSILKFSAIISVSIGIILTVIYIFMSQQIMSLFINDKEVIKYGKDMLIAVSLAGPILGILFLAINSMQAMEKAIPATLLSICRQGFIFIPALYILDMIFGLTGINYTQTFSDYVSIIISLFLLKNSFKSFDK
jgi:Na+-driven multidrug efflux pump